MRFIYAILTAVSILYPTKVGAQAIDMVSDLEVSAISPLAGRTLDISQEFDLRHLDVLEEHAEHEDASSANQHSLASAPSVHREEEGRLAEYPDEGGDYTENEIIVERERLKRIGQLETAYHIFNAADVALTLACLERAGCSEANPLFGSDPDPIVVVGTKVAGSVVYHLLLEEIAGRDARLAEIMAVATVAIQGGVVGINLTRTF